jgi:rRNA maturation endonuclease Nob1
MTAVQPKASTSWFKAAKKHCMACGKASTKVDRAACKSCGSTVWNLQAVAASQVHYLASLEALLRLF